MQFKIGSETVEIQFDDPKDFDAVATALIANGVVDKALSEHAASFYFRAWERDGDIDQKTLDKVLGIALDDGVEAAEQYMIENNFDVNPSDYYRHCEGREKTEKFLKAFFEAFEEANGIEEGYPDSEDFRNAVLEEVGPVVEDKMCDTDKSKPSDFFGSRDEVKVAFIQGYGTRGYLDDIYSSHASNTCQSDTVKPDRDLMLQFKLLNISPVEFVEWYKEKRGHDLSNPELGEGVSDYERAQYLENAQAWRFVCAVYKGEDVSEMEIPDWLEYGSRAAQTADVVRSCRDLDRPSAVSIETLEQILDNSSYGGVGTWYGRVSAREVMEGGFEKSFVATGGQIGIHDFINGSGYVSSVENDVLIDLRDGKLVQEDRFSYGPESVYGFTRKATDTDTKPTTPPSCVRYNEDQWRTVESGENGLHIRIDRVGGAAERGHVFHLSSVNAQNVQEGPMSDYELCGTLEEVKVFAADALKEFTAEHTATALPAPGM